MKPFQQTTIKRFNSGFFPSDQKCRLPHLQARNHEKFTDVDGDNRRE
jgi:hypothetical protein